MTAAGVSSSEALPCIIKAQNEEIAYMKKWQAKHAGK
jgi:uncharacterized protein (DUF305 family)